MTASSAGIQALLALQDLDVALDQHRHQRTTLPERAELSALEVAVKSTTQARAEVAGRRDGIAGAQTASETELAATEERVAAMRHRMASGAAGSARDVTALSTGIDHLRDRISHLEDDILTAMEERGPLDEQVELADRELATLAERRQALMASLAAGEARIDAEIA